MKALFLTLFLLLNSTLTLAAEGRDRLESFLANLKTMEATFVQTIKSPKKEELERSEGQIWLTRPNQFRLTYQAPYEQLIVADGVKVWLYDKDLEQVTVKPQSDSLGSSPASLLAGAKPLDEEFRVEELGLHEGFEWINLYPRAPDAAFDYIRVAMDGELLRAIEMVDGFGQQTRLYFDQITLNKGIGNSRYKFAPPAGVDVIGE
ncbi:MAG: outer membrane lipoprotein chaperone LolA [Gammaproteobacteria bacterium]|nr:outer membrane lipoprotein chaperone LolA [Gammaproteobacteria bacterium]